jgi:predicted XRE-type DNA-binding protein
MSTTNRRGSGDVFRDLGFSKAEAENLRLRSELMDELGRIIRRRRLTQVRAATLFGVSQPRVSDLVRGRIDRFSVDTLVSMLGSAGTRVQLVVKRRSRLA